MIRYIKGLGQIWLSTINELPPEQNNLLWGKYFTDNTIRLYYYNQTKEEWDVIAQSPYEYAVANGYNGTEEEFKEYFINIDELVNLIEITYSNLKQLVTNSELVPGTQYRIIDYICTTVQGSTLAAENCFDIIVTADTNNILNENARATWHKQDIYFSNSDLNAWELKYCIDNDTTRFDWADEVNGKGVIYYMKDEWGNECPYDFKNILFTRAIGGPITAAGNYYTFNAINIYDNSFHDATLLNYLQDAGCRCYGNIIKESYNNQESSEDPLYQILNNNIFSNKYSPNGLQYFNCRSNTFGNGCSHNTFGDNCFSNTFGNDCYSNIFDIGCTNNSFGNDCRSNKFGMNCRSNTFGNDCYSNTFGGNCDYNTFGNGCFSNTLGNYCDYNTFGISCFSNTFGNECYSNTFGNGCSRNTFGLSPSYKRYCRYFIIENGNSYLRINPLATTAGSSYAQNIIIKQGVNNSNSYVTIDIPANVVNQNYQWIITRNSAGALRQYCEADLVTSNTINSIEYVTAIPAVEDPKTLYVIKEE